MTNILNMYISKMLEDLNYILNFFEKFESLLWYKKKHYEFQVIKSTFNTDKIIKKFECLQHANCSKIIHNFCNKCII